MSDKYEDILVGPMTDFDAAKKRLERSKPRTLEEQLADAQHDIWSHWMRWFFDNDTPQNRERWKRQMVTPYAELSESERESDRRVVRQFLGFVDAAIREAVMPPPIPHEEIAERLYSRLLGPRLLGVGASEALDMILAALREAADARDAAWREAHRGQTVVGRASDGCDTDWKECPICKVESPCPTLLDARSRAEEPKP